MAESAAYDHATELLKTAIEQMCTDGLAQDELPLLLSHFAYMFAHVMDQDRGPVTLLTYMSKLVNNEGNSPRPADGEAPDEVRNQSALDAKVLMQSLQEGSGDEKNYDFSLIAHAMESLTVLQEMSVEQASACMVCYALGYLVRQRGEESGERLVEYAQTELARIKAEQADLTQRL